MQADSISGGPAHTVKSDFCLEENEARGSVVGLRGITKLVLTVLRVCFLIEPVGPSGSIGDQDGY
jgi:hypothetical protein